VIVIATVLGTLLNFLGVDPIDALFWTAVINGVVAPPLLVLVMLAARDPKVMGRQRIGSGLAVLGWIATGGMFVALVAFVITTVMT
jgi:Mn2+/Fe2+ NRAMP family transporter